MTCADCGHGSSGPPQTTSLAKRLLLQQAGLLEEDPVTRLTKALERQQLLTIAILFEDAHRPGLAQLIPDILSGLGHLGPIVGMVLKDRMNADKMSPLQRPSLPSLPVPPASAQEKKEEKTE